MNLSLWLTNYGLRQEGVWEVDTQIHIFLTSALIGIKWSASRICRFMSGEWAPGYHGNPLSRRLGDIQNLSGLYGEEKKKTCFCWKSNSESSAVQPVASDYTELSRFGRGAGANCSLPQDNNLLSKDFLILSPCISSSEIVTLQGTVTLMSLRWRWNVNLCSST
jgi:hypothetical protein